MCKNTALSRDKLSTVVSPAKLAQWSSRSPNEATIWITHLIPVLHRFSINTVPRVSAFLAHVLHESQGLRRLEENLRYSAARLRVVFPRHFPTAELANRYAGDPVRIANRVYASRLGNGDESSGDGWAYRGRGLLQLTGRANYRDCGKALALPLEASPECLLGHEAAMCSAAWFWHTRALNELADAGDMVRMTLRINGGSHGLVERARYKEQIQRYLEVLA
jgi:putative chitinase